MKTNRVLVIDADADFGARVRHELIRQGYDAGVARDARAGLQHAAGWAPDLVVVDAALPDQGGLDVLKAIRASKDPHLHDVRIIVTTATPSDRDRLQAAVEGALGYVAKPVDPRDLARCIRSCLQAGPEPEVRRRIQFTALKLVAALEAEGATGDAIPDPFDVRAESTTSAPRPASRALDTTMPNVLMAASVATLSARQQYIIALIGQTDTLAEAAERHGISPSALSARVRAITNRLGLAHPGELVAMARRHQVLDSSPDALYGVDADGICVFANRAASELLGYAPEELVGQRIHALIHHSHPDGRPIPLEECVIHQAIATGRRRTATEDVFWRKDGMPVFISCTVVPHLEGDERQGAVVTVRDVSPRVRATKAIEASRASMALALDAIAITTFEVDLLTGASTRSDNFEALLGLEPGSVSSAYDDFLTLVHPEDRHKLSLDGLGAMKPGQMLIREYRLVLPSGETRHYRSRARVLADALGRPVRLVGIALDVTEEHERRAVRQIILDSSNDAFVAMGSDGLVTDWNAAAERLFGYSKEHAVGRPMAELIIPPGDRPAHHAAIARLIVSPPASASAHGPREITALRADGSEVPAEISFTTVMSAGSLTFSAFVRDISERKEMEAELARQAVTDHLTKLPNRLLLEDRVTQAVQRVTPGRSAAVFFVDVDHIKVVNDSLGHAAGDEVLRHVGQRLQQVVTPRDTVARFGGDSFAIVVGDVSERRATEIAQELVRAFHEPVMIHGHELRVSVSVGIALTDNPGHAVAALIADADAAMYRAKELGRGRAELFDDAMRRRAMARLEMEAELRQAIEQDDLVLRYQPVVDLATGTISGVEALVRWDHPKRGLVSPVDFIPLAEDTGLIVPLGRWVLRTACAQVAAWACELGEAAAHLTMAVNLSGRQLAQPDLVELVAGTLAETGLDPGRLELEITESVLMEDSAGVALVRLHDLGVRLAVDDFGTGYSSLIYLRRFPVDTLKLDQFFVSGLARNTQDTAIVRSTIDLAHALGLAALAEGVEKPRQLDVLRSMGCDYAQGYLWSEPVTADEIARLLNAAVPTMAG